MPRPPKRPSRNTVTPMAKTGGPSRQATALHSEASLSNSSISSARAGASRVESPTSLRTTNSKTNNGDEKEPWMETATPGKFDQFQVQIFSVIEFLTSKPEHKNHAFTKRWLRLKRSPHTPMTNNITWRNLKILLGITTMFEYRDFLLDCPEFSTVVKIQTSRTTRSGFDFGIYSNFKAAIIPPPVPQDTFSLQSVSDDESYVFDIDLPPSETVIHTTDNVSVSVPTDQSGGKNTLKIPNADPTQSSVTEVSTTPKQANVSAKKGIASVADTDGSSTTNELMDVDDTVVDELSLPQDDRPSFEQVHYQLFHTVTDWINDAAAKHHPFYNKWQKAVHGGLTALSNWNRVCKLFKIAYPHDYINLMYECPCIQERYELTMDYFNNLVKCTELALPDTEVVLQDNSKFNALHRKLQHLSFKFESCMKQYNTRLDDNDARLTSCEINITEQLNRASAKFAASATKHYNSFAEYVSTTFTKFKLEVQEYTDKALTTTRTKLMDMHRTNHDKITYDMQEAEKVFHQRLEEAIERALQEILTTADEATDSINAQAEHILQQHQFHDMPPPLNVQHSWKDSVPKPSKLFPNVDISQFSSSVPPPEAPERPTMEGSSNYKMYAAPNADAANQWDKNGPVVHTVPHHVATTSDGLQMVNHHDFLKRVHLPYPSREQSYIWYLQLRSNAHQYGVYLIATEDFENNKSLCPREVSGYQITVERYDIMKCTLYHFLAQRTIISVENTDLRNIVNRHALSTDGYRVIYDIMQRVHPALNTDVTFNLPQSTDYSDIHEYFTQFTSYLMHEQFAGRIYKPREQLNRFIKGLDRSYAPAINRIRAQLDNWKTEDLLPPENLQLSNLPNLVEHYMEEDAENSGTAIVRRFTQGKKTHSHNNGGTRETPKDAKAIDVVRPYIDAKCPLCQSYGHNKYNCDRMALWLILKEGSKLVDDKLLAKLKANYAAVDEQRRSKKLSKIKGTVRQLYQNGLFAEGEQLLDSTMSLQNPSAHHLLPSGISDDEVSQDS